MTDQTIANDRLLIFTRYPEPGKAKTRLIPALGAIGAAELHRQMAEHTVAQAKALRSSHGIAIAVQFAAGLPERMAEWLGADLHYTMQVEGDLGDRMSHAFQAAFASGSQAVIIIGTDCPDLDATLLEKAFCELHQHDVVVGPAVDGGYYLIGLRRPTPALLTGIAWSTAAVLQQTVAIAESLKLAIVQLPTLADVDYPEDLEIWEQAKARYALDSKAHSPLISVIIPVLNEADRLPHTLAALQASENMEIIVVDGGSQDHTVTIAQALGARVMASKPGRACQMNLGASIAQGKILLFLHGDTQLPEHFDALVQQTLAQTNVVAGAFPLKIQGTNWGLRLVEWGVNWRSHVLQMPYGDQAIFLTTDTFKAIGMFPELSLMEDFELMRRLKRLGKVAIAAAPVLTADRRWQKLGIIKTTLINQLAIAAYLLGIAPAKIAAWYRSQR